MKRGILAVIAGYLLWTLLWLGGNQIFFAAAAAIIQAGQAYSAVGPLAALIALSMLCSIAAGLATATIAKQSMRVAMPIMAGLLLITGGAVQMGIWSLLPLWYHLTFLALIVPTAMLGGRLATRVT